MNQDYLNNTMWFNQTMFSSPMSNNPLFNKNNNWKETVLNLQPQATINAPKFDTASFGKTTSLWEGTKPISQNQKSGSTTTPGNIFGMAAEKVENTASGIGTAFDLGKTLFKPLDNKSTASNVLDVGSEIAKGFGPTGQIISAGLKGINFLDTALGKDAKSQLTSGEIATGYILDTSTKQGTRFGGLFGKKKRKEADKLTQKVDIDNIKKIGVSNQFKEHALASQTSTQDIFNKNRQQMLGGVNYNMLSAKQGTKLSLKNISAKVMFKLQKGGILNKTQEVIEDSPVNVIPSGALHSRNNNLPEELDVTKKGIPVVTFEEGGEITQHAEVEVNEIIFHKELTTKLEELYKKHEEGDKDAAIEAGKLLALEILENTEDNTGLIDTV